MNSGVISQAFIMCREGQVWTVGSDNPVSNGSVAGNAAVTQVADIGFSAANAANPAIGSLCRHGIHVVFGKESGLQFINKTYAVRLVYHHDAAAGNRSFHSSILGEGSFIQVYGGGQGFRADFVVLDNPNAIFTFRCASAKLQQWRNFSFANQEQVTVEIERLYSADSNTFAVGNTAAPLSGLVSSVHIKVKHLWWGKGQVPGIGAESTDNWYFFNTRVSIYPMQVRLEVDNMDMVTVAVDASLLFMQSFNNESITPPPGGTFFVKALQLYFYIGNLKERSRPGATANGVLLSMLGYSISISTVSYESSDNYVTIRFSNADVVSRLGSRYGPPFFGINNYITLDMGNFYRRQGLVPGLYLYSHANFDTPDNMSSTIELKGTVIVEDGYIYQGRDSYNTVIFNGSFKSRNGDSPLFQLVESENIVFSNCIAIAPPGATESIISTMNMPVLVNGLVTNVPAAAALSFQGASPLVDSSINNYFG
jgi:hypothetical protein